MTLRARPVTDSESQEFNDALVRLHSAGACHPVGRFLRLVAHESGAWVGGFVLRSTIPHVACRDRFFELYAHEKRGRFASSDSAYWRELNEIVNIGRIFVFPDFQGRGVGVAIVRIAESTAKKFWRELYQTRVRGLDCLDLAPPDKARIFTENGWTFLGRTSGHSRKGRRPSMRLESTVRRVALPSLTKINPSWFVYGKQTFR